MTSRTTIAGALGILVLLSWDVVRAEAQSFGRNKVQYERFDFAILETPHFDIYYYADEEEAARLAARMAERWYARLSVALDHTFERRQPVILYASHSHFVQTSVIPGGIPEGVGGFTDHLAGRVVLPFAAGLGETDHVLGHELVHAFQRDILRRRGRSLAMLPLWFTEGMAEYLSLGGLDPNTRMWLRDALASKRLPSIAQLEDPKYFPYRFGQAVWAYVAMQYGEQAIVKALKSRAPNGIAGRLRDATGSDLGTLSRGWHEAVRRQTAPSAAPQHIGRTVIGSEGGGRMNVGPALSPDGQWIVFLSERDGYSVDVFLADAESGEISRKLLSTAADPHFDSLQFLESAGAWSADGRQFVMATVQDGRPLLTIFEMPAGTMRQTIALPGVDQAFNPTWSPDGSEVAFSGLKGGVADLYAVAVADGRLRPLTNDVYSDLQPAWSPDGRRIAFATDRFSSSPADLRFGSYHLGLLDVSSGTIEWVGGLAGLAGSATELGVFGPKSIDPQWSPDGRRLFFVSDASGVSNVYMLDLADGNASRITDARTGVSGITSLSPSISLGGFGSSLAMSVYSEGAHEIRRLDGPWQVVASLPMREMEMTSPTAHAAASGSDQSHTSFDGKLASGGASASSAALVGDTDAFVGKRYVPRLSLAAMGQPYLTAGGGAFGSFLRAGTSFTFGDMLGQQELETAIQVGKGLDDFALQASYINRRSRWNWGVVGGQVPSLVGFSSSSAPSTTEAGEKTIVQRETISRQIHRRLSAIAVYPFNHAQRLEVSGGVQMTAFGRRTTTSTFDGISGELMDRAKTEFDGTPATLGYGIVALVYDTSLPGPTGPVLGQRYRLAVEPAFGDLNLITSILDYRRYVMPWRPLTIAVRFQQRARWGRDRADERLMPLTWSLRDVVRGFHADRDLVEASRFEAANLELRIPLSSLLRRDRRPGPLPIEAIAFSDWARLSFAGEPARLARQLWSVGAGARLNAAGFLFEFDAVRPMTPASGWRVSVNFLPGF